VKGAESGGRTTLRCVTNCLPSAAPCRSIETRAQLSPSNFPSLSGSTHPLAQASRPRSGALSIDSSPRNTGCRRPANHSGSEAITRPCGPAFERSAVERNPVRYPCPAPKPFQVIKMIPDNPEMGLRRRLPPACAYRCVSRQIIVKAQNPYYPRWPHRSTRDRGCIARIGMEGRNAV